MSTDTRTPAEIAYDATRDGSAYIKPELTDADDTLTCDEEIVIDHILQLPGGREIPIVPSRDQAERDERWTALLDRIEAMDEPAKSEAIGYTKGLLDGMLMHKKPAA
jgi:hypothetical protein